MDPMASRNESPAPATTFAGRHWLLIHDGATHPVEWEDGERLLELSSAIRRGDDDEQDYTFVPRGRESSNESVTIRIRADVPLELLVQYDQHESHWFG